jgi:peptidoglycan hydrolase-like protein with peptidoglycan-binding domain
MTVDHVTNFLTKIKDDIAASSYKEVYGKFRKAATMSIQMGLKIMGYEIGAAEVDGQRGPATRKAIQQFQALNGLNPDGFAGKDTIGKMLEVGVKKPATAQKIIQVLLLYQQRHQHQK